MLHYFVMARRLIFIQCSQNVCVVMSLEEAFYKNSYDLFSISVAKIRLKTSLVTKQRLNMRCFISQSDNKKFITHNIVAVLNGHRFAILLKQKFGF